MNNKIEYTIHPRDTIKTYASGKITCLTNAAYHQKAAIILTDADGNVVVEGTFTGQGEHNMAATIEGKDGKSSLSYDGVKLPLKLTAVLSFSEDGHHFTTHAANKVKLVDVVNSKGLEYVVILSEDSDDQDFNDMEISCITYTSQLK